MVVKPWRKSIFLLLRWIPLRRRTRRYNEGEDRGASSFEQDNGQNGEKDGQGQEQAEIQGPQNPPHKNPKTGPEVFQQFHTLQSIRISETC
jgi:hypothetical protein